MEHQFKYYTKKTITINLHNKNNLHNDQTCIYNISNPKVAAAKAVI